MTNLTRTSYDLSRIKYLVGIGYQRMRQTLEFPLSEDELIDVMYHQKLRHLIRHLRDNQPAALHWSKEVTLNFEVKDRTPVKLVLRSDTNIPMPTSYTAPRPYRHSDGLPVSKSDASKRLLVFTWHAHNLQAQLDASQKLIHNLVVRCNTHQQLYRALPELYPFLQTIEGAAERYAAIHTECMRLGTSRTKKVEFSPVAKAKATALFAKCLLLPPKQGLNVVQFGSTWVP